MNKEINQKVSQFLDDELAFVELDDLILKIKKHPELKSKMSRYQVMAQAMKTDHIVMADADFLDKINQQLKQEPHYLLPSKAVKKNQSHFWQKTSLAVAASVACVAVILSQQGALQPTGQPQQQIAAVITEVAEPVQVAVAIKETAEPAVKVANTFRPSQHERFKAYLQAHNDDLYTLGSLNAHPLAQVASYGQE